MGYKKRDSNGAWEYFFIESAFVEACTGFNVKKTLKDLRDRDLLRCAKNRLTAQLRVPGHGDAESFNTIKSKILNYDGSK